MENKPPKRSAPAQPEPPPPQPTPPPPDNRGESPEDWFADWEQSPWWLKLVLITSAALMLVTVLAKIYEVISGPHFVRDAEIFGLVLIIGGGLAIPAAYLYYRHWHEEQIHRRAVEIIQAQNQPDWWRALSSVQIEALRSAGALSTEQLKQLAEVGKIHLSYEEAARVRQATSWEQDRQRGHEASRWDKDRASTETQKREERAHDAAEAQKERTNKSAEAGKDRASRIEELLVKYRQEYDLLEVRLKYERPGAADEVQERMIKLKGCMAELEYINSIADETQRQQAFRQWFKKQ